MFFNLFFYVYTLIFNWQATPYGAWVSPITAEQIAQGSSGAVCIEVEKEFTYYLQMCPQNQGRYTIIRLDGSGNQEAMTPPDFNVRTLVHEYGGGAFTVANGVIYASNGEDSSIYEIRPHEAPRKLTEGKNAEGETRFADMHLSPYGLVAVGEHHSLSGDVENFLALIDTKTGNYKKLSSGHDFYSSPALSPDGKKIAWISWNHPNMPWTNTELWVADWEENGNLQNKQKLSDDRGESFFQPQWSSQNVLYFVTDRESGWWNLHRWMGGKIENVAPIEAEVGEPLWTFDQSTYAFLGDQILFTYNKDGKWHLALLNPETKKIKTLKLESVSERQLRGGGNFVRFLEGYPDKGESLLQLNASNKTPIVLRSASSQYDPEYLSKPQHIAFPSQGRVAYGFYYPPQNRDFHARIGEKPPLIVMIHGGPTAQASPTFQLEHQFWTSRGFALLDVDYGGSTGYGRAYRELLNHNWGVVDVEDCVNGALFLAQKGLVDREKLAIRGGSAGGYTTLAALAFQDVFKAGASYYGVADITALARDTHKFESRYMEQLVGKYPEESALWEKRSPLNSANQITSPLILFQGENDRVVPKNQSEMIYEAVKQKGVVVELHVYPDEEHGFRQAAHIVDSLIRENQFYNKVFSNHTSG